MGLFGKKKASCCCGSAIQPVERRKVVQVEYLYLDLERCDRCIGADQALEEVLEALTPALRLAGYEVEYRKIEVANADLARQHRFLSSPTIRVNGRDICAETEENACGCCSGISGTAVDCRVFPYEGSTYEVPPRAMLAEAILRGVGEAPRPVIGPYRLPENLKRFFEGKERSCGSGSCC